MPREMLAPTQACFNAAPSLFGGGPPVSASPFPSSPRSCDGQSLCLHLRSLAEFGRVSGGFVDRPHRTASRCCSIAAGCRVGLAGFYCFYSRSHHAGFSVVRPGRKSFDPSAHAFIQSESRSFFSPSVGKLKCFRVSARESTGRLDRSSEHGREGTIEHELHQLQQQQLLGVRDG